MPFYDLKCTKCDNVFNIMASMSDKEEKKIHCPNCDSIELVTAWNAAPAVIKGGKSAMPSCPNSHACGGCCPHAG